MDAAAFFEDLRRCYSENGLPFDYDMEKSVSTKNLNFSCKSFSYAAAGKKNQAAGTGSLRDCFKEYSKSKFLENIVKDAPMMTKNFASNEVSKWGGIPRIFSSAEDMLYTLAWELSLVIGRLPDAVHARMILSVDHHHARLAYVEGLDD